MKVTLKEPVRIDHHEGEDWCGEEIIGYEIDENVDSEKAQVIFDCRSDFDDSQGYKLRMSISFLHAVVNKYRYQT